MNPNMFAQMGPGALDAVPTTKKLWENEKSKYRHWIILFGISILIIFALFLTGIILNQINESRIKLDIAKWGYKQEWGYKNITPPSGMDFDTLMAASTNGDYRDALLGQAEDLWKHNRMWQIIKASIFGVGVILYASTVIASYKMKSFSKISGWATMAVGIGAFFGFIQLYYILVGDKFVFSYAEGIFDFILYILPIIVFFFISRPLNKIKRQFAYSERVQMIKNSPQYKQMMEQAQAMQQGNVNPNMGPMGPMGQPMPFGPMGPAPAAQAASTSKPPVKKELTEHDKKVKELSAMKLDELRTIAKELSISGISEMKKSELIDAILRVSE